jgi:hypothetical protein
LQRLDQQAKGLRVPCLRALEKPGVSACGLFVGDDHLSIHPRRPRKGSENPGRNANHAQFMCQFPDSRVLAHRFAPGSTPTIAATLAMLIASDTS